MLPVHAGCKPSAGSVHARVKAPAIQQGCAGVWGQVKATEGQSKANETSSSRPESSFRWFVSLSSKHRAGCVFSSSRLLELSQKDGPQSHLPLALVLGRQICLSPSTLFFLAITNFLPTGLFCSSVGGEERGGGGRAPQKRALWSIFTTRPLGWCPLWPGWWRSSVHHMFTSNPYCKGRNLPSIIKCALKMKKTLSFNLSPK